MTNASDQGTPAPCLVPAQLRVENHSSQPLSEQVSLKATPSCYRITDWAGVGHLDGIVDKRNVFALIFVG
jgi:hypothetical protein